MRSDNQRAYCGIADPGFSCRLYVANGMPSTVKAEARWRSQGLAVSARYDDALPTLHHAAHCVERSRWR